MSMDDTKYTVESLAGIAAAFDTFASDQIGAKRWQSTKKARDECDTRAEVWRDAAQILRNTTIVEAKS